MFGLRIPERYFSPHATRNARIQLKQKNYLTEI